MGHSTEKTELRELADLEIENVSGGAILPVPTYLTEEKDTAPKRVHFDLRK